jgi:hypothetical protein
MTVRDFHNEINNAYEVRNVSEYISDYLDFRGAVIGTIAWGYDPQTNTIDYGKGLHAILIVGLKHNGSQAPSVVALDPTRGMGTIRVKLGSLN